jgi:chorismate-pyruvate lyase
MKHPNLEELLALFPGSPLTAEPVEAASIPEPYRGLLDHEHHMTVTVEAHHGGPVDVRVLRERLDGPWYSREILLIHQATGKVVQSGIVRLDLRPLAPEVAAAIRKGDTPLGRVLIEHNVLRRIELRSLLHFPPSPRLHDWFGTSTACYGRLALIHCDEAPAVELLEVVAP